MGSGSRDDNEKGRDDDERDSSGGATVGTVGYMSPEQALGKTLDARTDLFALGVMLFEMATGRAPFAGDTPAAVFDHLLNRQPLPPLTLNPELPAALAGIIEKALEKDPERRYRSANGFLEDLRRVDFRTLAPPFRDSRRRQDRARRRRAEKPKVNAVCRPQSSCCLSST